jgi:hypothetical protein
MMAYRDDWHVMPMGDLRDHMDSPDCWCKPTQDEDDPQVYIHHALDQRERFETKGYDA